MKTKIIIISILVLILLGISGGIYYVIQKDKGNHTDEKIVKQEINESIKGKVAGVNIKTPLKKYPDNLNDVKNSLSWETSRADEIKILRFGVNITDIQEANTISITSKYKDLQEKNIPLIVTDQIIDIYVLNEINKFINENDGKLKKEIINTLSLNPLTLNLEGSKNLLLNINKALSIEKVILDIRMNQTKYSTQEIIEKINELNENEKEFLLSFTDTPRFIQKINDINKMAVVLGYNQILINDDNNKYKLTAPQIESSQTNEQLSLIDEINKSLFDNYKFNKTKNAKIENSEIISFISPQRALYYSELLNEMDVDNQEMKQILLNISDKKITSDELESIVNSLPEVIIPEGFTSAISLYTVNNRMYASPLIYIDHQDIVVSNNNFNEKYDTKPVTQPKGTVRIPVLMYHLIEEVPKVGSATTKSMYIDPKVFEEQMAYLVAKNYKTLSIAEFYDLLMSGTNPKQKSVLLTFDDSTRGQYINAYPILKKYGLKATYFVPSQRSAIQPNELEEMSKNGIDIESHSVNHPNLRKLSTYGEVYYQVATSKANLSYTTGKTVTAIAFPGCEWDTRTTSAMGSSGYKLGFSCGGSIDHFPSHRYVLGRYHVSNEMFSFKRLLSGIR